MPTLREQRLRWSWVLVPPFLLLARPTPGLLLAGAALALPGVLLRGVAAGYIFKDRTLATGGPFAVIRHPLYVGSFLLGSGVVVAGGRWLLLPIFLILFVWVYGRTIRREEAWLEECFGDAYGAYRRRVPAFLPRPLSGRVVSGGGAATGRETGPSQAESHPPSFQKALYLRNKEWQVPLGMAAAFGALWLRMILVS